MPSCFITLGIGLIVIGIRHFVIIVMVVNNFNSFIALINFAKVVETIEVIINSIIIMTFIIVLHHLYYYYPLLLKNSSFFSNILKLNDL